MKDKRRLNRIKIREAYTYDEICKILGISKHTISRWKNRGLIVLDENTLPFLVMGSDLKDFLSARHERRSYVIGKDEFLCTRCKAPRKSQPDKIIVVNTGMKMGIDKVQILIKGTCEKCGNKMVRFGTKSIR
jgi:Homeodomain-like domain